MKIPRIKDLNNRTCTEKYIKNHYFKFYQYILDNYPKELVWSEKLYWYFHNISTHPICPVCGKPVKFYNFIKGYRKYCSSKCNNSNPKKKLQVKQTCLERYGVDNPHKSRDIQDKTKQTCLERYGVEYPTQSEEIQNKYKQTCLKKYGVEHPFQSKEIQNKYKQTCLERYGIENPSQSQTIRNKVKQTCLEKYGVEYPAQSQEIRNKTKQTCLKKYSVEYPAQSQEAQNKYKQTNLERYGVEYPAQSQEIRNKTKQTCLKKYGVEYPAQSQEFQNKMKQTCLKKYSVEYYTQSEEGRARLSKTLSSEEVQAKMNNTKHRNHTFNSSEIESLFSKYLDSQNIEYIRQYRSKEYPFNCDFYLPKYDLYIEIQASWTHGFHPYESDNELDKYTLEIWKSKNTDFYKAAIETWTVRDINKRNIAKQNNLNYLEIFSNNIDEVIKCFNILYFQLIENFEQKINTF